eukprot:scaffold168544_cov43-Attheya_sp.AAC.2
MHQITSSGLMVRSAVPKYLPLYSSFLLRCVGNRQVGVGDHPRLPFALLYLAVCKDDAEELSYFRIPRRHSRVVDELIF